MLRLRALDPDDYIVFDDGQMIGRIRLAHERAPAIWLWTVVITMPGAPFGDAETFEEAKAKFESAWMAFKAKHGPEQIAKLFATMAHANRPGRSRP